MADIKRTTEADARIVIDELLRQASWDPTDKSQVLTERSSSIAGRADYVLLDSPGRPLAVIEAKREGIDPYTAKQQVLPYAKELGAPFVFLTNGEIIYFWDYSNDDARLVNSFYSRRDLERLVVMREDRKPLATIPIPDDYLRQGEARSVRPYQKEAMKALDHAIELGKRRFLIELPTGTGKTDLTCLYVKRLIQANLANRVLFLVDREQLAKQALEAMQDLLGQYPSYWLKPGVVREEKQITVCLLQSMLGRHKEFTSGYFDVVIADECHRSIYGSWQIALTNFDALHIGLTATPAEYIDRNTFRFYQCKDGQPDFSYPILQAFQEQFLVPYKFASGITEILADGAKIGEEEYDPIAFERKWTNEATNRLMMQEFDRLAYENFKELAGGQKTAPGKTIVFAITKHHAARLAHYLNELHPEYQGRYAEVITSDVADASELIRRFKREDLPQVAVSVGMLDTGFDCREILHLVMARRVRSPILYQQMRGRGTRTCPRIGKNKFVIYDFFGNHQYFNDSDTDVFTGTGRGRDAGGTTSPPRPPGELIELGLPDSWQETVHYVEVGPNGERVDKQEYITTWENAVRAQVDQDPTVQKIRQGHQLMPDEEKALAEKLNQPKNYFNEENLRNAYRSPLGDLIDFVKAALGMTRVRSREEVLNENFNAWLVSKNLMPEQAQYLVLLKNRGIARGEVSINDLFNPPLSILNAGQVGVELFGEQGLKTIIIDMDESVFAPQRKAAG